MYMQRLLLNNLILLLEVIFRVKVTGILNAHVIASWGVVTEGFYANLQGGSGGKITSVWQPGITVFCGTFANQSLWIQNYQASASSPAEAVLYFVGTTAGSFGSSTFYLRLYVGMSGMPSARFSIF